MRPLATLLACLALAGLAVAAEGGAAKSPAAGSYIVVFKRYDVADPGRIEAQKSQLGAVHGAGVCASLTYRRLKGFAARMSPAAATPSRTRGRSVEKDQTIHACATQTPRHVGPRPDRPAQPPLEQHLQLQPTGAGVTAYIIDTGIRTTHREFGGRASPRLRPVDDGNDTTTATATARTSPARGRQRRTAWRRR